LQLGHVFVANMTGNVVLLGFAVADAKDFSIPASLFAIASRALSPAVDSPQSVGIIAANFSRSRPTSRSRCSHWRWVCRKPRPGPSACRT
jgi:uncharacterized membrane protein YoaK (UPF0700 family)